MPKAYSYMRFSTEEQKKGDSQRRQNDLAQKYAKENGLELDQALTINDPGVSAFRGANLETGGLGMFLGAVSTGLVPRGSYLLVESLDRISRQAARKAQRTLEMICEAGITVVTLSDRKEYTEKTLDEDPWAFIGALLIFMRANEESTLKSNRIKATWVGKRANPSGKRLTRCCPGWLHPDDSEGFTVIPDRRETVRRIFRMALKGVGHHSIAATLNEDKVPPFKGSMWHRSYVAKTLSNPAVIGTFIPHVEEHRDGKLVRVPQLPMEGYYPAIVKKGDYLRVQSLRKSAASPQRGRHAGTVSNILGGLARCPRCGETMTLANKSGGYRYLVCTKAKAKAGCKYKVVKYWPIEGALSVYPERLTQNVPDMSEAEAEVRGQLKKVCFNLEVNEDALQQLIRVASSGGRRPAALLQKIDDQEQAVAELRAEERALQERLREFSRPALDDKLEALHDALCTSEEMDRLAVNTLFRQLFTLVTVNYMTGQLEFRWQHGGTTHVEYKWFAEGFGAERRSGSRVQSHPQRAVQAL